MSRLVPAALTVKLLKPFLLHSVERPACSRNRSEGSNPRTNYNGRRRSRSRSPKREGPQRSDRHRYRSRSSSSRRRSRSRTGSCFEQIRRAGMSTEFDDSKARDSPTINSSQLSSPSSQDFALREGDYYRPRPQHWPQEHRFSPRSRVQNSDHYRPPPRKSWRQQVEELSRSLSLTATGAPEGPRASRPQFRESAPHYGAPGRIASNGVAMLLNYDDSGSRDSRRLPRSSLQDPLRLSRSSSIDGRGGDEVTIRKESHVKIDADTKEESGLLSSTILASIPAYTSATKLAVKEDNSHPSGLQVLTPNQSKVNSNSRPLRGISAMSQLQSWISNQPPVQVRSLQPAPREYASKRIFEKRTDADDSPHYSLTQIDPPSYSLTPLNYD